VNAKLARVCEYCWCYRTCVHTFSLTPAILPLAVEGAAVVGGGGAPRGVGVLALAVVGSQLPRLTLTLRIPHTLAADLGEALGTSGIGFSHAESIGRDEVGPFIAGRDLLDLALAALGVQYVVIFALGVDGLLAGAGSVGIDHFVEAIGADGFGEVDTLTGLWVQVGSWAALRGTALVLVLEEGSVSVYIYSIRSSWSHATHVCGCRSLLQQYCQSTQGQSYYHPHDDSYPRWGDESAERERLCLILLMCLPFYTYLLVRGSYFAAPNSELHILLKL
jgi:hypothetical protein